MSKKLVLIDGSSMLVTSFFGNVPQSYYKTGDTSGIMRTSTGQFTNGVYTMSKILLNILEKQKPTHMAILWDVSRNDLDRKTQLFDGYKAHRPDTKPELSSQFKLMQELLTKMNIPQFKLKGKEADDIIGTFSRKFENDIPVYIITKDQDALQLITEKTRVWLVTSKAKDMYKERGLEPKDLPIPDGVFEYTPLTFEEEYGLKPIQIIDMKALEGDSSDNIPGVKGVGPSSVIPLLQEYGTIERIYEVIENNPEKELKKFFKEELGISRSPIANLLKKSNVEIVCEKIEELQNKLGFNEDLVNEINDLLKETKSETLKEKLDSLNQSFAEKPEEEQLKTLIQDISDYLIKNNPEIVGKKAAFLSKQLATIKTDIEEFKELELDELLVKFDKEKTLSKFQELEFKSLIDKV